jgi:hypothetical protein
MMKNITLKKALLFSLLIAPIGAISLSAKPHSPESPRYSSRGPSVGAFVGVKAPQGSIEIKVGNFNFRYNNGVFYKHTKHGYVVSRAPRGAVVKLLPPNHTRVVVGGYVYYRCNDVYYRQAPQGYIVVEEPVVVTSPTTVVQQSASTVVTTPVLSELSVWQGEQELLVRDGAFFKNTPEGYVWVEQPNGALTKQIPSDATSIWFNDIEYFDVDGILFRKTPNGYKVVEVPWK